MDNSELQPLLLFLNELTPFDSLDETTLKQCTKNLTICYYSKKQKQVHVDSNPEQLYIVRSGAFEVTTPEGELIDRVGQGQFFGFSGMLSGEKVVNQVHILEDGLVYHLPIKQFNQLRSISPSFDRFFNKAFAKRLRDQGALHNNPITSTRITHIMSSSLITITGEQSIQQAAQLMSEKRLSSLVVIDTNQVLQGIITDRDLRSRVLAKGLDGNTLIKQVMTTDPISIEANALVFEAMLKMSEKKIHHLPVVEEGKTVAIITSTDLMRHQTNQPLLLVGEIHRQNNLTELINVSQKVPELLQSLIDSGANAIEIGRILTLVSDALTQRLIKLKIDELGKPPFSFCWLVFGSQARQDQMAGADQDSALLFERQPNQQEKVYFKNLSEYVCKALDKCGYKLCPGDIMAQNERWQLSSQQWISQFSNWITSPDPKALLNSTIFFDMRSLYGPKQLFNELQTAVLAKTQGNDIFAAALTSNALRSNAPLGFFRNFVIERDGSEEKGIDLKHKGTALVNDIVRVYSLSEGIKEVSTHKRIEALRHISSIDIEALNSLADAWQFIAHKRLSNQGLQFKHHLPCNNYINPQQFSSLVRHQLKDAFKAIHEAQNSLRLRFLRQF